MTTLGIHWFRRDLRLEDNPAFSWQQGRQAGPVLGLFTFDSSFLGRPDFSHNRFQFFLRTLQELKSSMRRAGSDLLVLDMRPDDAFSFLTKNLPADVSVNVTWNRDYEPFARQRDQRVENLLTKSGWQVNTFRDHLIFEPGEILSKSGEPYKVFTPFSRVWMSALAQSGASRVGEKAAPSVALNRPSSWKDFLGQNLPEDQLTAFMAANGKKVTIDIPMAGHAEALRQLDAFAPKLYEYESGRDHMDSDQTSRLAMFLKNGSLSTAQIIRGLGLMDQKNFELKFSFLRQLIWREFYYHILWHFPHVENQSFNPLYRDLSWDNDPVRFEAWKNGQTGYPIVDAAMRELSGSGRMHNRARMIVASFLTKDLHIDWRWGERWFMNQLLDGDLAANNGGWQWAASTGTDPQPFFRIFNPTRQSEKFDPDGIYIRRWVPELAGVPNSEIHEPSAASRRAAGYPDAIVHHRQQAVKAEMMFRACHPKK